jgi:DNA (cytosine-5)-methyltransferase 1
MKILNLYSGIGGNRKLWDDWHDITAVECNEDIARVYKDLFPKDTIVIGDAHKYLIENYSKFDFIWSSPPCQSHSSFRQNLCVRYRGTPPIYPDMSLYQEILFLKYNFKGNWIVENVKPYYKPLIDPDKILQRHFFWCNFKIEDKFFEKDAIRNSNIPDLQDKFGYDLNKYKLPNKRQVLRNCVEPLLGKHIIDQWNKTGIKLNKDIQKYLF